MDFKTARSLIGKGTDNEGAKVTAYLHSNGIRRLSLSGPQNAWSGYFLASILNENGYATPSNYGASGIWLTYGSKVGKDDIKIGDVVYWGNGGFSGGRVGIVTGFDSRSFAPIVLCGDDFGVVTEKVAHDWRSAVFRRPVKR